MKTHTLNKLEAVGLRAILQEHARAKQVVATLDQQLREALAIHGFELTETLRLEGETLTDAAAD